MKSVLLIVVIVAVSACVSPEVVTRDAVVDSVEINVLESFPVQVNAVARGHFPDGCTAMRSVEQSREGNTFFVKMTTERPKDAICTQALVPFVETVNLDVLGLEAGTYTVDVNGVVAEFTLDADNSV